MVLSLIMVMFVLNSSISYPFDMRNDTYIISQNVAILQLGVAFLWYFCTFLEHFLDWEEIFCANFGGRFFAMILGSTLAHVFQYIQLNLAPEIAKNLTKLLILWILN